VRLRYFIFLAALVAAGYGGVRYGAKIGSQSMADYFQSTCESDHGDTIVNGTVYVCLTLEQAQSVAKRLRERGA
jgi:hypothetical protein